MLKRLQIKFICVNMLIAAVMLCVIFGLLLRFTKQNLEAESIRILQALATEPARHKRPDQRPGEMQLPYFILEIGRNGELIATDGGHYDLSDKEFLHEITKTALAADAHIGLLPEYALRYQRVNTPMAQRIVFVDVSGEQDTLAHLGRSCAAIGVIAMLAFLIISLFLAHWAIKPVKKAWTQQRQFVADASHELKTPLTVILTNAELLYGVGNDERSRRQLSEHILSMAQQMRGLVESLLELARVDGGTVKAAVSGVDFSELVSNAALPFEPLYFERGLELLTALEPEIQVSGSEAHLRQVIEILLDNAMKYSTVPATVTVELKRRGRYCLLSVANHGEAIPPEELKNIFKRFYRMDRVRTMNHSYGLGLSIAEGIVQEHKGKIWAESKDGLNSFRVELPTVMPR